MTTPQPLDHAITLVLFHYRNINNRMPFGSIPDRFTALYQALDHLAAEHEKASPTNESAPPPHLHATPDHE
jgi:hypothetical protein